MKKTQFRLGLLALAAILLFLAPKGLALAWHGLGGPTGAGTAALGSTPFSLPIGLNPPGYTSCLIGNFPGTDPNWVPPDVEVPPSNPGHALEHHWKVFSRGPTPGPGNDGRHTIAVIIGATSVNTLAEAGKVRATAIDAVGTKTIEVAHPITFSGDTAYTLLRLEVDEGVAYDLSIENLVTDPAKAPAHHYKIGAVQPFVELGYGHPILEYLEPGTTPWVVNAGPGEFVTLTVSVDPGHATSVTYEVVDPAGPTTILGPATSAVSPATPVSFGFLNTLPNLPKHYVVRVTPNNGHYKLDRSPAPDHGLYVRKCLGEPNVIPVKIDIKPNSNPSCFNNDGNGAIPVAILSTLTFDATQVDPETVMLDGLGVKVTGKGNKLLAHVEDVNGDGLLDLVVGIADEDGAFAPGAGTATLNAKLFNGQPIVGVGDICITQ